MMGFRLRTGAILVAWLGLALVAEAAAHFDPHRPPFPQPAAEAVGVPSHDIRTWFLDGPARHRYRIQAAALGPEPATGYPVLYLLDGNASMAALRSARHARPLVGSVLLVAVGYDTDAYFDTEARSLDYTPPLPNGRPAFDPRVPGRRGGGADAFLDFLQHRLRPCIAARWHVDPRRQGIWGHSYGGLFVLHTVYTRGELFSFYAAASPSLWWHAPLMAQASDAFLAHRHRLKARLLLMAGGAERRHGGGSRAQPASRSPDVSASLPAYRLAQRLRSKVTGLHVAWRPFPRLGHGQVFSASLGPAIRAFVGAGQTQAVTTRPATGVAK